LHPDSRNRQGEIFREPSSFIKAYDIHDVKAISLPDSACASKEVSIQACQHKEPQKNSKDAHDDYNQHALIVQ
jgi:hypothetical protein